MAGMAREARVGHRRHLQPGRRHPHTAPAGAALQRREVFGLSGAADLLVRVVARDADDLYRIAGMVPATRGVERTETALVMRELVTYRASPLLHCLSP